MTADHSPRTVSQLRILQVLEPSGGGSGRHFIDLCRGLKHEGHSVTAVYSPVRAEAGFVDELMQSGLKNVLTVPMERAVGPSDLRAWLALRSVIRRHGPFDIIHGHSSKAGALSRIGLPVWRAPRIYTPHAFRTMDPSLSTRGRLVYGGIERVLANVFSDRVICVSEDEYLHALSLGIAAHRLRLVVNGVAPPPNDRRAALRAAFGFAPDAIVFGFVGRLSPQKAPERLIAAFTEVARREPRARLLMVGSGELEGEIRQRIDSAGLGALVHLTDRLAGSEAMQAFDALVLSSRYEAMSYVMLEAAAAGKPLVLTDVGGAGTVLTDGVNGYVVPNQDAPGPLAEAMTKLCSDDHRAVLSHNAQSRSTRYGLETMIHETLCVYRELL